MEQEEQESNYKVSGSAVKKVDDLLSLDSEDQALKKWKEQLLGAAATEVYSPKDDPRRVVITDMIVHIEGRDPIVYHLESKEQVAKLKDTPFILKEECNYKIEIKFRVQHELVTGLKLQTTIYRKGIKVDRGETMIGSFGPQKDSHTVITPRKGWEEAPKGLLARGTYKATSKFIDDDNATHLEFDYSFSIKKDWSSKEDEE